MKWFIHNWKYVLLVVGLAVIVMLILDFNSRMAEWRRLAVERQDVSVELKQAEGTQAALKTQIAYSTSDPAVEEWAYEYGHMARPGDSIGVPESSGSGPEPTPTPSPTPQIVNNWQLWWSLFFDTSSSSVRP